MIARYVAVCLLVCSFGLSAFAQPSLADLVSENSVEWMFGKWQGQSEKEDNVSLEISWDLQKHLVVMSVKTGETEAKSYTVMEPSAETPRYYGFDNKGAVIKGGWNSEEGEIVLRVTSERPNGESMKLAFVFGGSPTKGLQVRVHGIDSSDSLTPARATYKFKKQS